MKKTLLFASLLFAGGVFAQGLTAANEPVIGDASNMFLCDSFATTYASVTGANVTWDYENIKKVAGEMKSISVIDPTSTANTADYPTSNKNVEVQGFFSTYWETTSTQRNVIGFIYNDASFGEVKAIFTNPATLAQYDFDLGDVVNDTYAGTVNLGAMGTFPATGTTNSIVDGKGTLKLNAITSLTDVIRVVTFDTLNATVPFVGAAKFIRAQYEYYHHATSKLPVFTHSTGKISVGANVMGEFTVVLSKFEPDNLLAVNSATVSNFSVYPNPVKSDLTIKGDFTQADAQIINQTGQVIQSISSVTPGTIINMNGLENGIYFLNLNINGQNNIQKIIKE